MAETKDTYYWKALFRDGSKLDQYEYESLKPDERKCLSDLIGLTDKFELHPTRAGYPGFGVEVPIDAAPQYMLFWKPEPQGKAFDDDGTKKRDIIVAIGFARNGISYMQGIELDSRKILRWEQPTPKSQPTRDLTKVISRVA